MRACTCVFKCVLMDFLHYSQRGRVELLAFQTCQINPLGSAVLHSPIPSSDKSKNNNTANTNTSSNSNNNSNDVSKTSNLPNLLSPKMDLLKSQNKTESNTSTTSKDLLAVSSQSLKDDSTHEDVFIIEEDVNVEIPSIEYREVNIPIRFATRWSEVEEGSSTQSSLSDGDYIENNALEMLVELQQNLWDEERDSYHNSLKAHSQKHPFVLMHSAAIYQKALCRLLEYSCSPLLLLLQQRLAFNQAKVYIISLLVFFSTLPSLPTHIHLLISLSLSFSLAVLIVGFTVSLFARNEAKDITTRGNQKKSVSMNRTSEERERRILNSLHNNV